MMGGGWSVRVMRCLMRPRLVDALPSLGTLGIVEN